jgi:hypothetical protein
MAGPGNRGTEPAHGVDRGAGAGSFDIEHTFQLLKQPLGWTRPKLRAPEAGDRWTWLIIAAHTQLRLTRESFADLRHPWEKPAEPARLTPARVRRGFRNLRPAPGTSGRRPRAPV